MDPDGSLCAAAQLAAMDVPVRVVQGDAWPSPKWILSQQQKQGVIKLPSLGGIKQYKSMAILRDFPYNNALFGLVV